MGNTPTPCVRPGGDGVLVLGDAVDASIGRVQDLEGVVVRL